MTRPGAFSMRAFAVLAEQIECVIDRARREIREDGGFHSALSGAAIP